MDYTAILREPLVEVRCGLLTGILHMDAFVCPGIHLPCIEYKGQMISPKNFTILGEKQNLKDWKKAVRIYKSSMRDLMERGYLDFYNHDQTCTGKCMGRTPSKNPMLDMMIKNEMKTMTGKKSSTEKDLRFFNMSPCYLASGSPRHESGPIISDVVGGQEHFNSLLSENELKKTNGVKNVTPDRLFLNNQPKPVVYVMGGDSRTSPVKIKKEPVSPEPDVSSEMRLPTPPVDAGFEELVQLADRQTSDKPTTDAISDSVKFWEGIVSLGLMDEFIKEIKLSLDIIRSRLLNLSGDSEKEAIKLSNVVNNLGLFKILQEKMKAFQRQTQQQQHQLNMEILLLEKKWSETQQWKNSLSKKQKLIEQVSVSSRLKRPLAEMNNGYNIDEVDDLPSRKSPRLDHIREDDAVSKPFIITVNTESMETEDFDARPTLTENPIPRVRNEDFLVTITSGHKESQAKLQVDDDDQIYSERQKELETEDKDVSQLDLTPRRSRRTRTLSAKGLAFSESENVEDNQDAGHVINPECESEISDETSSTIIVEKTETLKDVIDTDFSDDTSTITVEKTETLKDVIDTDQSEVNFTKILKMDKQNSSNASNQESINQDDDALKIQVDKDEADKKETVVKSEETLNSS